MKRVLVFGILLLAFYNFPVQAQEQFEVADIRIKGLSRISADSVFSYVPVGIGDVLDVENSRNTIKALFNTGFFEDIKLEQEGEVLVITVTERPSIVSIEIIGDTGPDDERIDRLLEQAGVIEGRFFRESSLNSFIHELTNYFVSEGRYGSKIESAIIPLDQNGVGVNIQIDQGPVARVREIRFVDNKRYTDNVLRKQSVFYGNSWTNLLFGRNKFSQKKLDQDLENWRSFYLDRGYFEFQILSNDVSISQNKEDVFVTVVLFEGSPYQVGRIVIDGTDELPAAELRKLLRIQEGMEFSRGAIIGSRIAIEKALTDKGHAFANVNPVPNLNRDESIANISFIIDPGPKVYVRRINVMGNTATQDVVIRREIRQMEGALYSGQKIKRSQERINRLGYFEKVTVEVEPVPDVIDEVDLNFSVSERKTGNLLLGIGYSDDERGFVQAEVSRKNLFGSGRELEISLNRSQIKQIYELEYANPYYTPDGISRGFFAKQKNIDASAGSTAGYFSNLTAFGLRYGIPTSEYNVLDLSGAYENIELIGVENTPVEYTSFINQHPKNESVVITTGFSRDTRDKILFPEQGYMSKVAAEAAIPGSDLEYYKLSLQARWYRPLTDKLVLGLGGALGYGGGYGRVTQLPFYKNFFAGGASSVRGYAAGSLGPRTNAQVNGDPLGGSRRLLANANLYFFVPGLKNGDNTRLSLFIDIGQVYGQAEPILFSDLRGSAGVAFNWFTAIGPLALSYGVPLNAQTHDRTRKFQITLGTLFR